MKKIILFIALTAGAALSIMAQHSPIGLWKTIDDSSGEAKSYVEIYEKSGKLYGRIAKTLRPDAADICEKCPGNKKNKPVVGLVIIEDLVPYREYWRNGKILDPESGNEYTCSIWFEGNNKDELKVRGRHWTGIYRTQTWHRVKGD